MDHLISVLTIVRSMDGRKVFEMSGRKLILKNKRSLQKGRNVLEKYLLIFFLLPQVATYFLIVFGTLYASQVQLFLNFTYYKIHESHQSCQPSLSIYADSFDGKIVIRFFGCVLTLLAFFTLIILTFDSFFLRAHRQRITVLSNLKTIFLETFNT